MNQGVQNRRVVVAMSGGVDSSVAAALLLEQGYEVIGISLKLWDYDEADRIKAGKTCCSIEDIADAKDVCNTLGIPFYAFNHKKEFQKHVIDTFVSEYHQGRTPNPCVLCNQFIKFDLLLNEAHKLGAAHLATGHYARLHRDMQGRLHLMKGRDPFKDQSYFLFHLRSDELERVLFPVGGMTKDEVRGAARKFGLNTHSKSESMEICFIPNNDHAKFIAKNHPAKRHGPGNFVDREKRVLGQHDGIECYTIGQRRGLGTGFGKRMYVAEIHPDTNEVVLAQSSDVYHDGAVVDRFYFTHSPEGRDFSAKVRHQHDEWAVHLRDFDATRQRVEVEFLEPARAITPGQALVLYQGDLVAGGGWIERPLRF